MVKAHHLHSHESPFRRFGPFWFLHVRFWTQWATIRRFFATRPATPGRADPHTVATLAHKTSEAMAASLTAHIEPVEHQLSAIQQSQAALLQTVQGLQQASGEAHTGSEQLREELGALSKQVGRSGREQLKANMLTEKQLEQFSSTLEKIQADEERREQELAALREQRRTELSAARLDILHALLPVLDSLDEALRSGQQLLAQLEQTQPDLTPALPAPSPGFFGRLFPRSAPAPPSPPSSTNGTPQQVESLRQAVSSWLVGLDFVIQRMLDVMASENVQPVEARGQPFDPQVHVALEVAPASEEVPEGTVAAELRRGYRVGERVLRHAEVVVAKNQENGKTENEQERETKG